MNRAGGDEAKGNNRGVDAVNTARAKTKPR
jgi:hypothetical protein